MPGRSDGILVSHPCVRWRPVTRWNVLAAPGLPSAGRGRSLHATYSLLTTGEPLSPRQVLNRNPRVSFLAPDDGFFFPLAQTLHRSLVSLGVFALLTPLFQPPKIYHVQPLLVPVSIVVPFDFPLLFSGPGAWIAGWRVSIVGLMCASLPA